METTTEDLFKVMTEQVNKNGPKMIRKVGASFRFLVGKKQERCWVVDLREGKGTVTRDDQSSKVDAIVEISDEDFALVCVGQLKPQDAFMNGRMKVKGNMMLAMKLNPLIRLMQPQKPHSRL
ncbi:unnamed protein product [Discosporangium mesarthrocarpum]